MRIFVTPPLRQRGIATASSYALRQKGRQCRGCAVFTPSNRRAGACSRRCNKFSLRSVYPRGNEYMRLPPRGGSAIGGGGECVCEIRNDDASSYSQTPHPSLPSKGRQRLSQPTRTDGASSSSFLPRSPSVTLRAPPALRNATNENRPLVVFRSLVCPPRGRLIKPNLLRTDGASSYALPRREQAPALRWDGIQRNRQCIFVTPTASPRHLRHPARDTSSPPQHKKEIPLRHLLFLKNCSSDIRPRGGRYQRGERTAR